MSNRKIPDRSEMPMSIAGLEQDRRGYPIPWFVPRPADGRIDFRVMDPGKFALAVKGRLRWFYGQLQNETLAFAGGPLSAAQRLYSDPPAHLECAEFSAQVCPFLTIPTAQRREANKPAMLEYTPGQIAANPGVVAILLTGGVLYEGADHNPGQPRETYSLVLRGTDGYPSRDQGGDPHCSPA
jgi:hypothetical protein